MLLRKAGTLLRLFGGLTLLFTVIAFGGAQLWRIIGAQPNGSRNVNVGVQTRDSTDRYSMRPGYRTGVHKFSIPTYNEPQKTTSKMWGDVALQSAPHFATIGAGLFVIGIVLIRLAPQPKQGASEPTLPNTS